MVRSSEIMLEGVLPFPEVLHVLLSAFWLYFSHLGSPSTQGPLCIRCKAGIWLCFLCMVSQFSQHLPESNLPSCPFTFFTICYFCSIGPLPCSCTHNTLLTSPFLCHSLISGHGSLPPSSSFPK